MNRHNFKKTLNIYRPVSQAKSYLSVDGVEFGICGTLNHYKRRFRMIKKLLMISLVFVFMLSGCGGGAGASKTINVEFTEFHFTPDSFTVPAGEEITVNGNNNGAVVHNFVIMKLGTAVGEDFGPEDEPNIFWQMEIQPGSKATAMFTAPTTPGDYQVVCRTQGHYVAGMIAKLTVVAAK